MAWPPVNHQDVTDAVTALRAAPPAHVHPVTDITTTGTRTSSTYLRGDGVWAIPPGTSTGSTTPGANMANESAAGIAEANTGSTNRTNYNAWTTANPGAPLFIRAGTYDFSGGSIAPRGPIYGAGPGITVLRFPEQATGSIYAINQNNLTFADFEIRSTGTATPNAPGTILTSSSHHLTLDNVTTFHVRNLLCNGAATMGIMLYGARRGSVTNCRVQNTVRDGIHITQNSEYVSITGNQVINSGDDCIAVIGYSDQAVRPSKVSITGNTINNGRARGITVEGGQDVSVTGNVISGTVGFGILINSIQSIANDTWPTENCAVVGNTISNAGADGMRLGGSTSNVLIADNVIKSPVGSGISLVLGRFVVRGNTIDDAGSQGILLHVGGSTIDRTIISGNTIRRPQQQGIYTQSATRLTICDNVIQETNEAAGSGNQGILVENGSNHFISGNRIDSTNSTRNPFAIALTGVTGGVVSNNVGVSSGGVYFASSTTGVTTSNNVLL